MKTYRVLTLTLLLAVAGSMLANNLLVENTSLAPGETRQVAITLKNPDKTYAAFQFDLLLPKGLSIAKNGNKLMASLDKDRKDDHRLTISLKSEGKYRLMAYSDSNSEFLGTDGPLVHVTLQADAEAAVGAKTVTIASQVFTEPGGEIDKWDDLTFTVNIALPLLRGDVNGDGFVNNDDLTTLVSQIIGLLPIPSDISASDIDGNNRVDIADVTQLLDILLDTTD